MWKWLSNLLSSNTDHLRADGNRLVSDEDFEFIVGTTPQLPDGLRKLKITQIERDVLILENFHIDFIVTQSYMDRTPEEIASASRCLRWAKTYHDLEAQPYPPVRLHAGNLLVSSSFIASGPEGEIIAWLDRMKWNRSRRFRVEKATSTHPLEDGYFACLRVLTNGIAQPTTDPRLSWDRVDTGDEPLVKCLSNFVATEFQRTGEQSEPHNCEPFIRRCYAGIAQEQLVHPVFALLDFPSFDMGCVRTTFSGSIWSDDELRYWSRPTYFHK